MVRETELLFLPFTFFTGWKVVGVFMCNWDEREEWGQCRVELEWVEVCKVCTHLDIPCQQVNFVKEYWNNVFR